MQWLLHYVTRIWTYYVLDRARRWITTYDRWTQQMLDDTHHNLVICYQVKYTDTISDEQDVIDAINIWKVINPSSLYGISQSNQLSYFHLLYWREKIKHCRWLMMHVCIILSLPIITNQRSPNSLLTFTRAISLFAAIF